MKNTMIYSITGRSALLFAFCFISVTSLRLHLKEPDSLDDTLDRLIKQAEASGINKTIVRTKSRNDSNIVYLSAPSNAKQKSFNDIHNEGDQALNDLQNIKHAVESQEIENKNIENTTSNSRRALQLDPLSRSGHHNEETDNDYSIEIEPILEDTTASNLKLRNGSSADLPFEHETNDRNNYMFDEDHSEQNSSPVLHENPENLMEILKQLESETVMSEKKPAHTEKITSAPLLDNKKNENYIDEKELNTHYLKLEDLKKIKDLLGASKKQKVQSKDIKHSESDRTKTVRVTDDALMKTYLDWLKKKRQDERSAQTEPLKETSTDNPSSVTIPELTPVSVASITARLAAMQIPTRTVINTAGISLLNRPCRTCPVLTPFLHTTALNWKYNQYRTNHIIKRLYQPNIRRTVCTTCRT